MVEDFGWHHNETEQDLVHIWEMFKQHFAYPVKYHGLDRYPVPIHPYVMWCKQAMAQQTCWYQHIHHHPELFWPMLPLYDAV